MFSKQLDILAVGDITTDTFIRLKDAHIHCRVDHEEKELCLPFGEKVPFEYVKIIKAVGNAANVAVTSKRLGLKTAIMTNIGDDQNGKDCLAELQKNGIMTSNVIIHSNKRTNYNFVLWYDVDRTILVNHTDYDYHLPASLIKNKSAKTAPKWIYLTSLSANTFPYHMQIADYLEANPTIKLAFQPGTYQIKLGIKELERIYKRADFFIVNMEEARRLLLEARPRGEASRSGLEASPRDLLKSIHDLGPKLVVITDSSNGAYLFDGDHYYHMPIYPDARPPLERTGCGDAWAATFVGALALGKTPLEALMWAPINPMSVAQFIGSQEGLLHLDQLEWWLSRAPMDYRPKEI
jgi:sugar/nucleoside kinase (ribokinase family)